jgi:hypothetical protein
LLAPSRLEPKTLVRRLSTLPETISIVMLPVSAEAHEGSARRRMAYATAELEALRGAPSEEAQARLWGEVRAALAAAGFSGEYNGLLAADEEPRSRKGNKGRKGADGGGAGVGRKWGEQEEAAAPRFSGTVSSNLLRKIKPSQWRSVISNFISSRVVDWLCDPFVQVGLRLVRGEMGIWGVLMVTALRLLPMALVWRVEWLKSDLIRVKMWSMMNLTVMMTMMAF